MKNESVIKETENGYYYEGYLGAPAWKGKKSDTYLHGGDLSRAIRHDLKENGITGVSVRCETYSGGQCLHLTLKAKPSDYVSKEEFIKNYDINKTMNNEIIYNARPYEHYGKTYYYTDTIRTNDFFKLPAEEQKEKLDYHKNYMYDYLRKKDELDAEARYSEDILTKEFQDKVRKIDGIVSQYNHDESNSMVDYFCNNFYVDCRVKPSEPYITEQEQTQNIEEDINHNQNGDFNDSPHYDTSYKWEDPRDNLGKAWPEDDFEL